MPIDHIIVLLIDIVLNRVTRFLIFFYFYFLDVSPQLDGKFGSDIYIQLGLLVGVLSTKSDIAC